MRLFLPRCIFLMREQPDSAVWQTEGALLAFCCLLFGLLRSVPGSGKQKMLAGLVVLLSMVDLGYQASCFVEHSHVEHGSEVSAYVRGQSDVIHRLQEEDPGTYRITQTATRNMGPGRRSANYDEPLAYGYWSITHYSSTVDDRQLAFLDRVRYRNEADTMDIVNTSILPADALLGVKYVLSDYAVNGLKEADSGAAFGKKRLYENPYVLPMAFYAAAKELPEDLLNPFEYQNALYSSLLGREIKLFLSLAVQKTAEDQSRRYQLALPEGNYAVYGNVQAFNSSGIPILDLNGKQEIEYSCWLAPLVFYIPTERDDQEAYVTLTGDVAVDEKNEQFYVLDLDLLGEVTQELRDRSGMVDADIRNGHIFIRAAGDSGDREKTSSRLLLTVPYDSGWSVVCNGEAVEPELWANMFYSFPLASDETVIEMTYHVPFLKEGLLLSAAGLLILCILSAPGSLLGFRKRAV